MTRRDFLGKVGSGCAALPWAAGCTPQIEPPLRVGAIVWPGYESLFLARALGHFDGLPIKLVEYTTTPEAIRSFLNGALEVVAITGDEFLRLAVDEPAVKAFLVADFSNGADALIAQPEFECVRELEGKKVGVQVNTTGAFILTRALSAVGMTSSDIKIVPLENDFQPEAFKRRDVDAVITFDPARTKLLAAGGRVLFDSSRIPGEQSDLLVARTSTLADRGHRLQAVARAWFAARDVMINEPMRAAAVVAEREGLSPAAFIETLKLIALPSLAENRKLLSQPDSELMAGLLKVHRVLREHGQFSAAMPTLDMLTTEALP